MEYFKVLIYNVQNAKRIVYSRIFTVWTLVKNYSHYLVDPVRFLYCYYCLGLISHELMNFCLNEAQKDSNVE